jgi:2,3-bisphosphoglycerate-independent phosphoglycerate mutase
MKLKSPFALIILDGLGHNPNPKANAVESAKKPTLNKLFATCPYTELTTFGEKVGLPDDQMGNSEVGHLNIGAGRVVEQDLLRINKAIRNKELRNLSALKAAVEIGNQDHKALHFLGLCSYGGVHSSLDHLYGLLNESLAAGAKRVYIHAISDGRDRPQTASLEEIGELDSKVEQLKAAYPDREIAIVDLCGRYYSMDRDKRWERTKLAFDLYTKGIGEKYPSVIRAIDTRLALKETDEFYKPCVIENSLSRSPQIEDGDALICFNFRADRMRQIVSAFLGKEIGFDGFETSLSLGKIVTLTEYSDDLPVDVLFPSIKIKNHLGETLANLGYKQLRLAETEKYPHVTYFFNGGTEDPYPGEDRIVVPSPRDVATYDLKPEMSAKTVTDRMIESLEKDDADVYIVNFANCDMVGHTGNFEAAVKAVETVDACVTRIIEVLNRKGGSCLITADHGNADQMIDYETGEPHTFHTKHPVPIVLVGPLGANVKLRTGGALCDIAPTILELLKIEKPSEMTGLSLVA